MCGQWVRPVGEWAAPQSLLDFLAGGEPPIYVGFGSMVGFDQRALLDAIVKAIAGRRALFYPGWSGAQSLQLPPNFFVTEEAPHDWLLPRTAMAIHHGGSGTTHSACRAGVPSIVLPFAGDQAFWAEQLRLRGVAPETTAARHVSAEVLKRAIETAGKTGMRERAATLGAKMRTEDGVGDAVARIHSIVRR